MTDKKNKINYIESFDWLRGVGCIFILIGHGSYGFFKGAWIALDLFFILSGYLITALLLNEYSLTGNLSFSKFYARRALKLFPPLVICILLANILWPYTKFDPGANEILATSGALFYFTNFLQTKVSGNMIHLWSLSVEEHFYFLWPIILLFYILKKTFRTTINILVSVIFVTALFRIFVFNFNISSELFTIDPYRSTFAKVDSITLGALLAFIVKEKSLDLSPKLLSRSTLIFRILFLIYMVILFSVSQDNVLLNNGGFIITNLLATFTIFFTLKNPNHYFFRSKIVRGIGKRSYSIYLYHFPIFLAFEAFREPHNFSNFIIITLLRFFVAISLAFLSYKYIERPILQFKKRYEVKKIQRKPLELESKQYSHITMQK